MEYKNKTFGMPKWINDLMKDFDKEWFVCGGWAVDLFLGRETRMHNDIKIGIFRDQQLHIQKHFSEWEMKKVIPEDKHNVEEWKTGEKLELPIYKILSKKDNHNFEILLNERNETDWIYRLNPSITHPLSELIIRSTIDNIPILTPEVVLLHKAKNNNETDDIDFINIYSELGKERTEWFKSSMEECYPNHYWLSKI